MRLTILLGALALALAGCSTVTVQTDYDHAAKFDHYHTYALSPPTQGLMLLPAEEAVLRSSLRENLAAHGLTEATGQSADLEIVRQVFTHEQTTVEHSTTYGVGSPTRYNGFLGSGMVTTDVRHSTEGTLMLDFVDAKTRQLVFRGMGKGTVGSNRANLKSLEEMVAKMLREFPQAATPTRQF